MRYYPARHWGAFMLENDSLFSWGEKKERKKRKKENHISERECDPAAARLPMNHRCARPYIARHRVINYSERVRARYNEHILLINISNVGVFAYRVHAAHRTVPVHCIIAILRVPFERYLRKAEARGIKRPSAERRRNGRETSSWIQCAKFI